MTELIKHDNIKLNLTKIALCGGYLKYPVTLFEGFSSILRWKGQQANANI